MGDKRNITIGVMLRHIDDKGGISVYTRNMLYHMLKLDQHNQYVLFFAAEACLGTYKEYPNVREVLVSSGKAPMSRLIWDQYLLPKYLKRYDVDVVFNPKLSVPLFAGCKTVFTMHGLEQFAASRCFMWHDRLYFKSAMRLYCRKADAILCATQAGKADLQRYLGAAADKIRVIPYSYNGRCRVIDDESDLRKAREKFGLPDRFLLFVGGIAPLKNVPTLLRAFNSLKRKGYEHKLVIVGFRRWKHERDMAVVSDLGLDKEVIELGFVDDEDLPRIYNLADCYVLPSFYEGFGIPILEAQACGCPVVMSNPAPMKEVSGSAALIFDPRDYRELAEEIATLLENEELRAKLIERGLENVKKYDWSTTAEKTIRLLEETAR